MLPHAKRMQTLNGFQTESMPLSKQLHLWTAKVKWLDLSKKCSKTIKKGSSWTIGVKRAFFAFYFDEPPKNHFMNLQGQRPTSRGTTGCFQAVKADGILNTHRLRCQWWVHWIFDPTFRLSVFWTQSPWHPWVWQDWAVQSKSWSWRYGHQAILHISSHLLTSPHISSHLLTSPHISSHLLTSPSGHFASLKVRVRTWCTCMQGFSLFVLERSWTPFSYCPFLLFWTHPLSMCKAVHSAEPFRPRLISGGGDGTGLGSKKIPGFRGSASSNDVMWLPKVWNFSKAFSDWCHTLWSCVDSSVLSASVCWLCMVLPWEELKS